jgi:hypothetical protein
MDGFADVSKLSHSNGGWAIPSNVVLGHCAILSMLSLDLCKVLRSLTQSYL